MQEQTTPLELPFKILLPEEMGNRNTARENAQLGLHIMKIPLDKIIIRENFNCRVDYGNIPELGQSLITNGQRVAGIVDTLANGLFAMVAGHRRYAGWKWAQEETKEPQFFYAVANTNGNKITDEDRMFDQFLTQHEKPLEEHEKAELFARLISYGNTAKSIAKRISKTDAYVSMLLKYTRQPEEVKEVVRSGALTVDTALKAASAIKDKGELIEAVQTAATNHKQHEEKAVAPAKSKEEKQWEKNKAKGEAEDEQLVYDENLIAHRPTKESGDNPDDIIAPQPSNEKKGKRISLTEITAGAPVYIPTLAIVRKTVEAMKGRVNTERSQEYNEGFADCAAEIFEMCKTKNTKLPDEENNI